MLSIHATDAQKCTPNLLPARINHNGPIDNTQRYWTPERDDKGNQHAYLRGRHLHGLSQPLPENYKGAVLNVTDKALSQSGPRSQDTEDDEQAEEDAAEEHDVEVKIAEQVGEFDEIVVWGHGGKVDGAQDGYIRGMNEWVAFAESMHVDKEEQDEAPSKKDS